MIPAVARPGAVALAAPAPRRVAYYRVPSRTYPRNHRIRAYLTARGTAVTVVDAHPLSARRLPAILGEVLELWRASRGADAVLLAEVQMRYALAALVVAGLRRCPLVVDAFVGVEESLRDTSSDAAGPLALAVARAFDRVALRRAGAVLIDTRCRAEHLAADHRLDPRRVVSLPVGAPAWTGRVGPVVDDGAGTLRVLYYGNYIPLHGVTYLVDALALVRRPVEAVFVGDGQDRPAAEARARALGLDVTFLDAVPEHELVHHLQWSHVVIGIFGSSRKAATVIANKVWQGLGAGRTVITRDSPALDEISAIVGGRLRRVAAADAHEIAAALDAVDDVATADLVIGRRLEAYVERQYDLAWAQVLGAVRRPPRGRR